MPSMKKRNYKTGLILAVYLLTILLNESALALDAVTIKTIDAGSRAPFSGVLVSEDDFRAIDIELLDKDLCERKLAEKNSCAESATFFDIYNIAIGFVFGAAAVSLLSH